ncbi:ROK family protein [Haloarcula sp. S1AR25-5A]|uniref:ROK family protein n=1 Tax=Haloarcula terrestris TaxID=2950533 RepID=A0AAE4F026_9EURY|nr:ROK family protein [Haloarcula terrestris]MDS0223480.1 ROK family protein [Haloarcula terrestris]
MGSVLAIDIGGTTIRGVKADASGLQGDPWTFTTNTVESANALVERISDRYSDIDAIGVAAAAVVNRETNELRNVANWAGWDLTPLADSFSVPLAVENDADASALGLKMYGDVAPDANLAYLTLSTGIGAGILRNGELIPGAEAGFVNVNWDGKIQHSGVNDPWEGYASGSLFPNRVQEWLADEERDTQLTGNEDARAFFEAVRSGDHVARDYYTRLKRINAAGIGTITDLFSTDRVKVGGGVALNNPALIDYQNDPYTLEPVDLDAYCMTATPEIELTSFGVDLELYGAAAAAIDRFQP